MGRCTPSLSVDSQDAHRWVGAVLGAIAAAAVTALGWRLARRAESRSRIVAAGAAGLLFAVNPIVAGAAPSLMAEALILPVAALVLLVTDRLVTGDGHGWDVAALGALLVVGALTRSEAVVVLGAAVVGGWFVARRAHTPARSWVLALSVGVVAVVAWSVVISVASERPVLVSTNSGSLLLGANCRETRTADGIGYWAVDCLAVPRDAVSDETARRIAAQERFLARHFALPPQIGAPGEADVNRAQFDAATDEIANHPFDTLAAVPMRWLRGLGLYWSPLQDRQEAFEGRDHSWEVAGRWFNIVLVLPFALVTLCGVLFRRSRLRSRLGNVVEVHRLVPSLALIGAWLVTIALSYGSARFRAVVEPSSAVLAGLGYALAAQWVAQRGRRSVAS